jgi:hypothetical protein
VSLGFPKPRPAIFDKRDRLRERERVQQSVSAAVNERDGYACRCCGRQKGRGITLHRHHLTYRSRGGPDSTENECLVCALCHALIHARQLWVLGTDADTVLRFEIDEAAVVEIFGTRELPKHVRIVLPAGRRTGGGQ